MRMSLSSLRASNDALGASALDSRVEILAVSWPTSYVEHEQRGKDVSGLIRERSSDALGALSARHGGGKELDVRP